MKVFGIPPRGSAPPVSSAVRLFALAALLSVPAAAQTPARLVAGRVLKPSNAKGNAPIPVAGQWVVLHRVGTDRAAPADSARSGPDGRFRIPYSLTGAPDALYFVSARYDGIAYFSPPLRADTVRGGDADVIVYETTSDTASLHVQGRHFVVSRPRGETRAIAEIFELENDGTHTVVARDSLTPVWTAFLPPEAESLSVGPGDIGSGAVALRNGRAELFAPISPGVRQLVLTYSLRAKAFPVSRPIERPVSVLEVLLEEPTAGVEGARLAEVTDAIIDGRAFRRFMATDVPAAAVIRVTAPPPVGRNRALMRWLAGFVALAMAVAVILWLRRSRVRPPAPVPAPSHTEVLVGRLAALDARFEREGSGDAAARARYERERASLKEQLARALAAERTPA